MGKKLKSISKIIFAFGFLKNISLKYYGTFHFNELFAIFYFLAPRNIKKLPELFYKLKTPLVFLAIICISQVFSDILNHSPLKNSISGPGQIILAGIIIIFLFESFQKSPLNILSVYLGYGISLLCFVWFNPRLGILENGISRLLIAPTLTITLLWISFSKQKFIQKYIWLGSILVGLIVLLILDSRSRGLIFCATGIIYAIISLFKTPNKLKILNILGLGFISILFIGFVFIFSSEQIFTNNRTHKQIEKIQNAYNPLEIIKITRPPVYVCVLAIAEKPWIGYGSWPMDKTGEYYDLAVDINKWSPDKTEKLKSRKSKIIPSHSILFGTWLHAGIIALLSIFLLFVSTLYCLLQKIVLFSRSNKDFLYISIYFLLQACWGFIFEPVQHLRFSMAIIIAFAWLPKASLVK
tara:strand:+ start:2231 stop:3460 length:1230 start_codon:yes stop_codon:yes gene_type:complete